MPFGTLEPMEYSVFHRSTIFQVLDHNTLEQLGGDVCVPDSFGIHDDNRSVTAYSEAGSLAALHTRRTKEQIFALQQLREQRIQLAAATIW